MDILLKLAFKSFLNPLSLFIYDISNNIIIIVVTCSLFIIFTSSLLFFYKKKKTVLFLFNFVLICFITILTIYSYNRGRELNEIRDNGFLLLKYIEKLRTLNHRYPYNIDEIYAFISENKKEDFEKVLKTKNVYNIYNMNTNDTNSQKFNLTIYDDILGFEYFAYRVNPIRFELTDD